MTNLGHVISHNGIAMNPANTEEVVWKHQAKQYRGFTSYYWKYVTDFATIAHPSAFDVDIWLPESTWWAAPAFVLCTSADIKHQLIPDTDKSDVGRSCVGWLHVEVELFQRQKHGSV